MCVCRQSLLAVVFMEPVKWPTSRISKINIVQDAIVHVVVEEGFEEVETEVNVDLPDVSRKLSKSKGNYLAPLPRRNSSTKE